MVLQIKSLLGHRSQAAPEIRLVSGRHLKDFCEFLQAQTEHFVVEGDRVRLKNMPEPSSGGIELDDEGKPLAGVKAKQAAVEYLKSVLEQVCVGTFQFFFTDITNSATIYLFIFYSFFFCLDRLIWLPFSVQMIFQIFDQSFDRQFGGFQNLFSSLLLTLVLMTNEKVFADRMFAMCSFFAVFYFFMHLF